MDDRSTIAYLVRPADGGIKTHLLTLLSRLDTTRFKAVVICPPDSTISREIEKAGHTVIHCDIPGDIDPMNDLLATLHLRRILGQVRPAILHIHSMKAGLVGRAAVATMLHRPKVVLTFHSFVFDERVGLRKRAVTRNVERLLGRFTDRIIAVSNALRDQLISEMAVEARKAITIHNGIAMPSISRATSDTPVIGTISRLAPQKGVEYFIKAAAVVLESHPAARFKIVGDGPRRQELVALAESLGILDRVEFMGFRADIAEILATLDVYVLASTWETFGLTVAEALAMGVPVVASRVGGIPEIVDGSTTGLLAEPADPSSIALQICRFLSDRDMATRFGDQGREFVRSHFTADRMASETQQVYLDLLTSLNY